MKTPFEYQDYRAFLTDYLKSQNKGAKLKLSAILECQPGYVSQILSGSANLSAEQAEKLCAQMGWGGSGIQYFLTLVAHARAGTPSLRRHLQSELSRMRSDARVLKNRFKPEKILSVEDQSIFYSSWHYAALHVCVSIPGCETEEGISNYFDLPVKRINEVIQFLVQVGIVKRSEEGRLSIGQTQVYLGSDSPLISKHHTNWRLRAIEPTFRTQNLRDSASNSLISLN